MSSADPTNTGNELFPNLLPEEPSSPPRKPRTRKPKSSQHPSESPAPEPPEPAPTLAPDPFWAKVDALWAKHGMPLRPKVIMRTDPKTGKTVFTNTDLVPELAPRQEGAQWAASPSSGESVTQPPEKSTAKIPNCDASSVFCGTSKTPSTPAVSGDDNDLHTKRPHEAHSNEFVTAKKAICDANRVFCGTDPVPTKPIAASDNQAFGTHRLPSAVLEPNVTQPPEKSTAKIPNCDASSVFCGTSKTPSTPAVSGDDNDLHTKRPHEAHSDDFVTAKKATYDANPSFCGTPELPQTPAFSGDDADSYAARPHTPSSPEEPAAKSANGSAMEIQDNDPPEIRLKKRALKIFQNGGSYKTVAGNLGISRDKARTWKRLWEIGRFEDNIRGIRFSGDYSDEIKAKVRERLRAGATPGELEKEFKIPRQTIRKWQ